MLDFFLNSLIVRSILGTVSLTRVIGLDSRVRGSIRYKAASPTRSITTGDLLNIVKARLIWINRRILSCSILQATTSIVGGLPRGNRISVSSCPCLRSWRWLSLRSSIIQSTCWLTRWFISWGSKSIRWWPLLWRVLRPRKISYTVCSRSRSVSIVKWCALISLSTAHTTGWSFLRATRVSSEWASVLWSIRHWASLSYWGKCTTSL